MFWHRCLIFIYFPFCLSKSVEVTFKDVTFRGFSAFTEKFKKTIPSGNKLADFLPDSVYDAVEMRDQDIPVLYKDSLADLEELDELTIEFCKVDEIKPGAISNVPMLRKLSLKGNNLKNIPFGVFNNLHLSTLDLSLNQISTIHGQAFDNLPDILNINLADNTIDKWNPEWFQSTPLLTRVSLQNNSIEELPANAFQNLKGDKHFGRLNLNINLIFSYNKISHIDPKAFADLENIRNLWLDNNLLESFNEHLLENITIDDLRLNKNLIKCFDGDLDMILKADTNHIDSNPFDCDCLQKIKKWSEKKKNVDFVFSEMDCIAQRLKVKMTALVKRLKEIRDMDKEGGEVKEPEEIEIFEPQSKTIK